MSRYSKLSMRAVPMMLALSSLAQGQQAPAPQPEQRTQTHPPEYKGKEPPLFFRETWSNIPHLNHAGPIAQQHLGNRNLELKLYGSALDTNSERGMEQGMQANDGKDVPPHIFTGLCDQPCALALRDKKNYIDLSGLGKVRWLTAVTGLHQVHPIIKLADGTWLLGEHSDGTVFDYHPYEFTLSEMRWIAMDMTRVVTRGRWLDKVDLSTVDEIGFADLMPGSGHGDGGFINVGWIEVYGTPVPRPARLSP